MNLVKRDHQRHRDNRHDGDGQPAERRSLRGNPPGQRESRSAEYHGRNADPVPASQFGPRRESPNGTCVRSHRERLWREGFESVVGHQLFQIRLLFEAPLFTPELHVFPVWLRLKHLLRSLTVFEIAPVVILGDFPAVSCGIKRCYVNAESLIRWYVSVKRKHLYFRLVMIASNKEKRSGQYRAE